MDRMHMFTSEEVLNIPVAGTWTPLLIAQSTGISNTGTYSVNVSAYHQVVLSMYDGSSSGVSYVIAFDNIDHQTDGTTLEASHNPRVTGNSTITLPVPKGSKYFHVRNNNTSNEGVVWIVGM